MHPRITRALCLVTSARPSRALAPSRPQCGRRGIRCCAHAAVGVALSDTAATCAAEPEAAAADAPAGGGGGGAEGVVE